MHQDVPPGLIPAASLPNRYPEPRRELRPAAVRAGCPLQLSEALVDGHRNHGKPRVTGACVDPRDRLRLRIEDGRRLYLHLDARPCARANTARRPPSIRCRS